MERRHPLETPYGFFSETRAYRLVRDNNRELFRTLSGGLGFQALTRTGKTALTRAIEAKFQTRREAVFLRRQLTNVRPRGDEKVANAFHRRLRGDENGTDASDVFTRPLKALKNFCLNECDKLDTDTIVFCLDEAQRICEVELDALLALTNDLGDAGLRPFVIFFGQPTLVQLRDALLDWRREELVTRWMGKLLPLPAFNSQDFKAMCKQVDTLTWPEDSGISYTAHYLPDRWRGGWRMEAHAAALWAELSNIALAAKLPINSDLEVGGEYAVNAVQALLKLLKKNLAHDEKDALKEAARQSRLSDMALIRPDEAQDVRRLRAGWKGAGKQKTAP